jgi:ribosomal protein S18 acetylase RimI-like enzyme
MLAHWKGTTVGAICCRLDAADDSPPPSPDIVSASNDGPRDAGTSLQPIEHSLPGDEVARSLPGKLVDPQEKVQPTIGLKPTDEEKEQDEVDRGKSPSVRIASGKSETPPDSPPRKQRRKMEERRLYIMTLAVLPVYRSRGVGSRLLESVLQSCQQLNSGDNTAIDDGSHRYNEEFYVSEVCLHVQTSNADAIRFYTERFGFTRGELIRNYYVRVDPPDCYFLYKRFLDEGEHPLQSGEESIRPPRTGVDLDRGAH